MLVNLIPACSCNSLKSACFAFVYLCPVDVLIDVHGPGFALKNTCHESAQSLLSQCRDECLYLVLSMIQVLHFLVAFLTFLSPSPEILPSERAAGRRGAARPTGIRRRRAVKAAGDACLHYCRRL